MKKILIVSENSEIQDLPKSWKGRFGSKAAGSFEEAVDMCEKETFDVLIVQKEIKKIQMPFREFVLTMKVRHTAMQTIILMDRENDGEKAFLYHWMSFDIFIKGKCNEHDIENAINFPKEFKDVTGTLSTMNYYHRVVDISDWVLRAFHYLTEKDEFISKENAGGTNEYYFIFSEENENYEVTFDFPCYNDNLGEKFEAKVWIKNDFYFKKNNVLDEKNYPIKIKELIEITEKKYRNGRRIRGIFDGEGSIIEHFD